MTVLRAFMWLGVGALLAWAMLRSQAATVSALAGRSDLQPRPLCYLIWRLGSGLVLRGALATLVLFWAVQTGLPAVLLLLSGFWLMRTVLIYQLHRGRILRRYLYPGPGAS